VGTADIKLAEALGRSDILSHAPTTSARATHCDDPAGVRIRAKLEIALAADFQEHAARAYTNLASMSVSMRDYERGARI